MKNTNPRRTHTGDYRHQTVISFLFKFRLSCEHDISDLPRKAEKNKKNWIRPHLSAGNLSSERYMWPAERARAFSP
jgi:hypothetical protein